MPNFEVANASVSIIIPTYNEQERLCSLLRSLDLLAYRADAVQIIVIDDASPNFDPVPVKKAIGNFGLKLIRHSTNQGRARTRNTGIRAAVGDVVVFLDSDMSVEPDFLNQHMRHHRQAENKVVVGHISFGPGIEDNSFNRYLDSRGVKRLRSDQEVPFNYFVTGNSSLKRALLTDAGLFDEDFTAYGGEDLELGYRLHLSGAQFIHEPQARSLHHHVRPLAQTCDLMYTYGNRSLPQLVKKHPGLAGLLHLGPVGKASFSPKGLLRYLALRPALYAVLVYLAHQGLNRGWIPDLVFSYLIWYNRTRGYLNVERS
jgi:GT2 family glycosyltransferase